MYFHTQSGWLVLGTHLKREDSGRHRRDPVFPALDPGVAPGAQVKLSSRVVLLHEVGQDQPDWP